jgi:hypothetical protein
MTLKLINLSLKSGFYIPQKLRVNDAMHQYREILLIEQKLDVFF